MTALLTLRSRIWDEHRTDILSSVVTSNPHEGAPQALSLFPALDDADPGDAALLDRHDLIHRPTALEAAEGADERLLYTGASHPGRGRIRPGTIPIVNPGVIADTKRA